MDKKFSEGFMLDMADLMEVCMKGKTDTVELDFDINGEQLNVEITFSVNKGGESDEERKGSKQKPKDTDEKPWA